MKHHVSAYTEEDFSGDLGVQMEETSPLILEL